MHDRSEVRPATIAHRAKIKLRVPSVHSSEMDEMCYDVDAKKWSLTLCDAVPTNDVVSVARYLACLDLAGMERKADHWPYCAPHLKNSWQRMVLNLHDDKATAFMTYMLATFPNCITEAGMWIDLVPYGPNMSPMLRDGDGPYQIYFQHRIPLGGWTTPSNITRGDLTYPMFRSITLDDILKIAASL